MIGFCSQVTQVPILIGQFFSCVTLGLLLHLSEFCFSFNGISTLPMSGFIVRIGCYNLVQCLVHYKHSVTSPCAVLSAVRSAFILPLVSSLHARGDIEDCTSQTHLLCLD